MIKELVKFTEGLDDEFKDLAIRTRDGLHILLKIKEKDNRLEIDLENIQYERFYSKITEQSGFIQKCKNLQDKAWCIDTNKCFDLPKKAIHSCSPFCVAFKKEHYKGGSKFMLNEEKKQSQLSERFDAYFEKAFELLENKDDKFKYDVFKLFFTKKTYEDVVSSIESDLSQKRLLIIKRIEALRSKQKACNDKVLKKKITEQIKIKEKELIKELTDKDYLVFYLDEPVESYKKTNEKYLKDKLFNTANYNTEPDENGLIYGTSDFYNGFNIKMPFLLHNTASFKISGRISNDEARYLHQFKKVIQGKVLPNPLPIFIYKEELNSEVVTLFKRNNFRCSYKEIIEHLIAHHSNDIANYYLLYWVNTKDGVIFKDLDFVSKFEYSLKDKDNQSWKIKDIFNIDFSADLDNVFSFQNIVLQIIFNNNLIVKIKDDKWRYKYFDDLDAKYCKSNKNYILIQNYRESFYHYIYKSQRQAVTSIMFHEIMKVSILEDIRLDEFRDNRHTERYNICKKLNIWFSLYENFDFNLNPNDKTMASKLNDYQQFVKDVTSESFDSSKASVEELAFATGQVIYCILKKSKSSDQSYQRLERYLNQATFTGFKQVISAEFARYKHENFSNNFRRVASFVLAYDTKEPIKKYLPQILAGVFANNILFGKKLEHEQN